MSDAVLVVGAGSLGSVYGARLARGGSRVQLLAREAHARAIEDAGGVVVVRGDEEELVPLRAEYLSLESFAHFLRWYRDRRAPAQLAGILLTMVNYRRPTTGEIIRILRGHNRRGVFRTEIPEDPRAAEAPSYGIPLVRYGRSKAAVAYRQLTKELIRRVASRSR